MIDNFQRIKFRGSKVLTDTVCDSFLTVYTVQYWFWPLGYGLAWAMRWRSKTFCVAMFTPLLHVHTALTVHTMDVILDGRTENSVSYWSPTLPPGVPSLRRHGNMRTVHSGMLTFFSLTTEAHRVGLQYIYSLPNTVKPLFNDPLGGLVFLTLNRGFH
jgi:hypothetical protein